MDYIKYKNIALGMRLAAELLLSVTFLIFSGVFLGVVLGMLVPVIKFVLKLVIALLA